jgi:prepilin peptidase CpaA
LTFVDCEWVSNCAYAKFMHSIAFWPTILVLAVAVISDLRSRRIPNWLVFPFLLAGLIVSLATGGWSGLAHSASGVLVAAIPFAILYLLGGMGMGDVKLCAGLGAWLGPSQLILAMVLMGLAGGVMALTWAIRGGFTNDMLNGTADLIFGLGKRGQRSNNAFALRHSSEHKMPYAPAIAVGVVFSFLAHA